MTVRMKLSPRFFFALLAYIIPNSIIILYNETLPCGDDFGGLGCAIIIGYFIVGIVAIVLLVLLVLLYRYFCRLKIRYPKQIITCSLVFLALNYIFLDFLPLKNFISPGQMIFILFPVGLFISYLSWEKIDLPIKEIVPVVFNMLVWFLFSLFIIGSQKIGYFMLENYLTGNIRKETANIVVVSDIDSFLDRFQPERQQLATLEKNNDHFKISPFYPYEVLDTGSINKTIDWNEECYERRSVLNDSRWYLFWVQIDTYCHYDHDEIFYGPFRYPKAM